MRSYRGNFGILQPWQEGAGNGSHWCQTLGQTAQCRRFGRGLMCTVDLTPFRMHRALLAVGSELASKGKRTRAARRGSVATAASISQKHQRLVARGRIGSIEMAHSGADRSHTKGHAGSSRCNRTLQRLCDGCQLPSSHRGPAHGSL